MPKNTVRKVLEHLRAENAFVRADQLGEFAGGRHHSEVTYLMRHEVDMGRAYSSQLKRDLPYFRITAEGKKWLTEQEKNESQK